MKAGFGLLVVSLTPWAAAGCAAQAARRAPTSAEQTAPPIEEPSPSVFREDRPADIKSNAIDVLSRIIVWHNRQLTAMQPRLAFEYRGRPTPAKPPPATGGQSATTAPGAGPAPPTTPGPAAEAPSPRPVPKAAESPAVARRRYYRDESEQKKRKTALDKCEQARRHARAICRAAAKICRLADQLDEQPARERCAWARNQCRAARTRAGTVCRTG